MYFINNPGGCFHEKFFKSDVDDGLLLVDFLSLRKRFSWARYKTDLIGFLAAFII